VYSAVDRIEECAESGCSFWEPGTAVLEPGCALERLGLPVELERNPPLAHWRLKVRALLDEHREREEQRRFLMPLPPGCATSAPRPSQLPRERGILGAKRAGATAAQGSSSGC
jgi:hypothetical protein